MKNWQALIATSIVVSTHAIAAEKVAACWGGSQKAASGNYVFSSGLGEYIVLDSRDVLRGKTITIAYFADAAHKTGLSYEHSPVESDPVVRTFTDTSVTESSGGKQATYKISYEGPYWCRTSAVVNTKQCFAVVGQSAHQVYEALLSREEGHPCHVLVEGKLIGFDVPAGSFPEVGSGGRRRQR